MTKTLEGLSPVIFARITELRKPVENATTELTALLETIEPPNTAEDLCLPGARYTRLAEYPQAELGTFQYGRQAG